MTSSIEHSMQCLVCLKTTDNAIKLKCDHIVCETCANNTSQIKCPRCNIISDLNNIHNYQRVTFSLFEHSAYRRVAERSVSVQELNECSLCRIQPAVYQCVDCEKHVCSKCEASHLSATACSTSKLIRVDDSHEVLQFAIKSESERLKHKIIQVREATAYIYDTSQSASRIQVDLLQQSRLLRQACINDVDKLFDSFDVKIASCMEQFIRKGDIQKDLTEQQVAKLEAQQVALDSYVNSDVTMDPKGRTLVSEAQHLADNVQIQAVNCDVPTIKLMRNDNWKASDVATLEIKHDDDISLDQHQEEQSTMCAAVQDVEIDIEPESKQAERWVSTLRRSHSIEWDKALLWLKAHEVEEIRCALTLHNCPVSLMHPLTQSCVMPQWPEGINHFEQCEEKRRKFLDYVYRKIPGSSAVLVMASDNQHMPPDMVKQPGFVVMME